MSRLLRRFVPPMLALLVAFGASACDDDNRPEHDNEPLTQRGIELTAPGSTLEVGESAVVPLGGDPDDQVVRVTVTDITKGSAADIASLEPRASAARTPYYVHYELELLAGGTPHLPTFHILSAWSGHTQLDQLTVLVPFPTCEERTFERGSVPGTVVKGCATYVTEQGGRPLNRMQFSNDDNYNPADDTGISWE